MNRLAIVLVVVIAMTIAIDLTSSAQHADAPTFRVRADFDMPLNNDGGWAGAAGESVDVVADQPFRLRMEVALADTEAVPLGLEYRRNGGEWLAVEAHAFPYPLREFEIDYTGATAGGVPGGWRVVRGDERDLAVVASEAGSVLRARAGDETLVSLYASPWVLPAFSFAADYRLGAGGDGQFGLVFGYEDPANHWLLWIDAGRGRLRLTRVIDGDEAVLEERSAGVLPGEWFETEVKLENDEVLVNFADDTLEFSVPARGGVPASDLGIAVPAGGQVDFRGFVIEGEPGSPRGSIVAATAYEDAAETTDLLTGSAAPFAAGAGVSLSELTPPMAGPDRHTEVEWPLVVRKFADGGAMNESGDIFEFRVTGTGDRRPGLGPIPSVTLDVSAGHLGGTFVETPGRVGPWQARNGDLYFIMEPAESDNLFMMVKSSDGGESWREVDGVGRPMTGDLESVDARVVGDTVHIVHQVSESVRYHAFRTSDHPTQPDTWAVTDELATAVTAVSQMASLVVRPDGSLVAFYLGDTVGYAVRSPAGEWSAQTPLDNPLAGSALVGPQAALGKEGTVHVAYVRTDGTVWHQRLTADGELSPPAQLAAGGGTTEDDWGAVLPLVYLEKTDTLVVIYRLADGGLWERRIVGNAFPTPASRIVDSPVVQHAVDSQQVGADAAADGETVYVLFIDEAQRSIYTTNDRGGWQPSRLLVDEIDGAWVRGNIYSLPDGRKVYGYVYDAGSAGGAGFNRYGELEIGP